MTLEEFTMWTGAHVRAFRDAARLTQHDLADLAGCGQRTVSFWESRSAVRISVGYQARLDMALAGTDHGVQARFRTLTGDLDVNRRDFISATGVVVGASAVHHTGTPQITDEVIGHLRSTVHAAQMLDDKVGSNAARPIIEAQAQTCATLLRDCPATLRADLQAVTSEATASSAWAAWDQGDLTRADLLFRAAFEHVEEAGDSNIMAGILCHRTQLAVFTRNRSLACDISDHMLRIQLHDNRVDDFRKLCAAQAYAAHGRTKDGWKQLDRVANAHADQTTPELSYCYYQSTWTTGALTARCLETSGQTAAAGDTIEQVLHMIPMHATRDRALWSLSLAQLVAPRDIDRACAAARDALDLADLNTSPRVRQAYVDTRAKLGPWSSTRAVRELDQVAAARR